MNCTNNRRRRFEGFDYSRNLVYYRGHGHPFRALWFDVDNCEVIVSVESLNNELMDDQGAWRDKTAQCLDEKIIFYVDDSEITLPDTKLQTILTQAIS